jgi:hypothetical protein
VSCRLCGSKKQTTFNSELNIHFPGPENLTKPTVSASPKLLVCLDAASQNFTSGKPNCSDLARRKVKNAALAPLPRKESKAAYSRKLFFFYCSLAKLCFELDVVNGTPW